MRALAWMSLSYDRNIESETERRFSPMRTVLRCYKLREIERAMFALAQRRPGMLASVVTGQYCSVHQLLFIRSLQEWLSFSPAQIAHAFGDAMQVVEAPCPRCLAMA